MLQTRQEKSTILLDPRDPMPSARMLVRRDYTHFDDGVLAPTLHHAGGDFLAWKGTHYERLADDTVRAVVWTFLENAKRRHKEGGHVPFQPTTTSANDVFNALKAATHLGAVTPPTWLPGRQGNKPPARELLACANGILHIGTRELHPHTPEFVGLNALPYAYSPRAATPTAWLAFLASLWPDDPETVQALQEWTGYCLTQDTRFHKIMLLIGPKRSGKGTIGRVLTAMLGADNVAGPTLGSLATQFGLEPLLDKPLAIVSDARLGGRSDQSTIAERLLAISGEDGIGVDRKHRTPLPRVRLPVRFMLLSNEAPRIADASGALASRFVVLQCTQSFLGKEDHGLERRLLAELPGILLWSLEGLARLQARQRFVQPASAADAIRAIEDLGSPIGTFIRDCCEVGPDKAVERSELYSAWRNWSLQNGLRATSEATFGRDLAAAVPGLKTTMPRVEGKQVRHYAGVALLPGLSGAASEFEPIDLREFGLTDTGDTCVKALH